MLNQEQVKSVVDAAFHGVDKSVMGPVFIVRDKHNLLDVQLSQPAYGAFTIVLTAMMREGAKDV